MALRVIFPVIIDLFVSLQPNSVLEFNLVSIFVQIENDDDILWTPDIRERDEEIAARGQKFLKW